MFNTLLKKNKKNGTVNGDIILRPHQHPSLSDLRSVAADIKDTLTVADAELI